MSPCDDKRNKESKIGKGVHSTGERVGFKQVTLEWRYGLSEAQGYSSNGKPGWYCGLLRLEQNFAKISNPSSAGGPVAKDGTCS